MTNELKQTIMALCLNDGNLFTMSQRYIKIDNYFPNMCGYSRYQHLILMDLMSGADFQGKLFDFLH